MPPTKIILRMAGEYSRGDEYVFGAPGLCLIGRAEDCDIQLPALAGHADVSRRHCLIEVTASGVRVRDLGSLNGTFINGKKIGQRQRHCPPDAATPDPTRTEELRDGDEITVGQVAFRIGIVGAGCEGEEVPLQEHEASC